MPSETTIAMRGLIDRAEDQERAGLGFAWHGARLGRVERFPSLQSFIPRRVDASKTQSPEEFAAAFAAWGAS